MSKIVSAVIVYFWGLVLLSCNSSPNSSTENSEKGEKATSALSQKKNILIFGNSLTAGYGLEPDEAYPSILQQKIDSLGLPYKVINAGVSGETTAGGNSRLDWVLKTKVDIFVLELGGNDGLRGIPASETRKNLQAMIDKVKAKYPDAVIILAGMQVPPSMGKKYGDEFRGIYPQIAKDNNVALIPFLLEGVGGEVALNQKDGIHPNAQGAKIVAHNVWEILKDLL
ncbi:MAG: arylesterase [Runella sp.]